MNLETTLSIYAGGPGSGCTGENCGRPSTGDKYETYWHGTLKDSAAKIFKEGLHQDEGQRFKLKKGTESRVGYVYMTKDRDAAEHFAVTRAGTSTTGKEDDLHDWQGTPAIVELHLPAEIAAQLEKDPDMRTEVKRIYGPPIKLPPSWMLKGEIPKQYVAGVQVLDTKDFKWKSIQAQAQTGVTVYLVYRGDLDALRKHLGLA